MDPETHTREPSRAMAALGFAGGVVCSSTIWIISHGLALWVPAAGGIAGAAYVLASPQRAGLLEDIMSAAALVIPFGLFVDVIAVPVLSGGPPAWTSEGMRAGFPALVDWVIFGCLVGLAFHVVKRVAPVGPVPMRKAQPEAPQRIVIVGGGFGGMMTALKLEALLGADRSAQITLVSDTNALLFTPMLAEVAGGSLEPTHISSPLRTGLRRTHVVAARVTGIDFDARTIEIQPRDNAAPNRRLPYDHAVLALGSVSNFFGQENIARVALDFKSLGDAIRIRNRVIALFERADSEPDQAARRALLTFVVAGGGFAGVELAGALNDFARGIVVDYTNIATSDINVIVVHPRDRILPELSETLALYARARMVERGVQFRLLSRVTDASPTTVLLDSTELIGTNTLIWTAGTAPNPLLARLAIERDKRGSVVVDAFLKVTAPENVWALGDCAAIPNRRAGGFHPPTAQHALREAATVARNIRAAMRGEMLEEFAFDALGALCVIGHQTACAEIRIPMTQRKLIFSGIFAWLLWRGIYLGKLPGFDRKVRVMVDWMTELFFPRDIVQTIDMT